ncbi:hypothetical protein [Rhodopseudomonas telluris]|uniref:Uncharacterized protein n=1 Tax=Rhodopseudomonas telluris TaxID=644215 RepID=A0ABV6EUB0_9BRAD
MGADDRPDKIRLRRDRVSDEVGNATRISDGRAAGGDPVQRVAQKKAAIATGAIRRARSTDRQARMLPWAANSAKPVMERCEAA